MAKNTLKANRRPRPPMSNTRYNSKTLMHDRQYGFFWYAWLWKAVRPLMVLTISLIIILGLIAGAVSYVNNTFFAAPAPGDTAVLPFVIERGDFIATVGKNLHTQGFIKNQGVFRYMVQFMELTEKIQFGTFGLSKSMNVSEVIGILAQGNKPNETTITVIPGWTVRDVAAYFLRQGLIVNEKDVLDLCANAAMFSDAYYPIAEAQQGPGMSRRTYALEGYLAPDTYRVYSNSTPQQLLETLLKQSETVLDRVFNTEHDFDVVYNENGERIDSEGNVLTEPPVEYESTLTHDETIILASIIEKEAASVDDYRKVSAVLHNRLIADMRLECDSTVNYALNTSHLILSNDELLTQSPYNTYTTNGLPAGPICNPSERALIAALYPDMDYIYDGYLYFCARNPAETNSLEFSKTKEEHEAAVAQYRPSWLEYDERQSGG